jgi:ACS family hexuronate transporter-like MFS transporter
MSWVQAAQFRETWGFAIAKFFSDPVWWFYLYWLPLYLREDLKLEASHMAWLLVVVYGMADVGSVFGGWLSRWMLGRGWSVRKTRLTALLIFAVCMPVASTAVFFPNLWVVVALVSVATSAHQAWSANLYTTVSDVFPKNALASVTGIGGFMGGLAGIFFSALIPSRIVANFGYPPAFLMMGVFHLTGWLFLRWLFKDFRPVGEREAAGG